MENGTANGRNKGRNKGIKKGLNRLKCLYYKNIVISAAVLGGLVGFFILSPIGMVVEHLSHSEYENLGEHLKELYLMGNPLWSALFTVLGAVVGLFFGYLQRNTMRLQERLAAAKKLASLGQLAAGVAHEINTPLTNIALLAENLGTEIDDPDMAGRLTEIEQQVGNASTIVANLLEFSRRNETEYLAVDVNDLISNTLMSLNTRGWEDVDIGLALSEDLPLAKGNPRQLRQVFLNMINNAIDAMPQGGRLDILTSERGGEDIEIRFRDTGTGIPEEAASMIFDPFFTTKKNGKGIGLGLSICYGIVRSHDGEIEVESGLDKGTTFKVTLQRWES